MMESRPEQLLTSHRLVRPRGRRLRRGWVAAVEKVVLQNPLIESNLSLKALAQLQAKAQAPAPQAVFVGLGLGTRSQVSASLPVDVFGMLLPAEQIRRACGASSLLVVVADEHAISNNFDRREVEIRAQETVQTLWRAKIGLSLRQMHILRASDFHHTPEFQEILAEITRRAPPGDPHYFTKEVADIAFLDRMYGGIIKVGWTISSGNVQRKRDEVAFDRRYQQWVGQRLGFVYCKAGRALDDSRPKASPYVALDPERRVCLRPDEDVQRKLARACKFASPETIRGVRKHLKAVTRNFSKLVEPLRGPVDDRVQSLIASVFEQQAERSALDAAAVS